MTLDVWRHPRTRAPAGLCLGRADVPVDRRKAKRLAHRIRAHARRERLARHVVTSPSRRSAAVGRVLAGWGWRHRIDARLDEFDFGSWDGRPWAAIGAAALQAWTADFARHRPGGGESVGELLARCRAFLDACAAAPQPVCAVGHAGWISAALWWRERGAASEGEGEGESEGVRAADWPAAVAHGERRRF